MSSPTPKHLQLSSPTAHSEHKTSYPRRFAHLTYILNGRYSHVGFYLTGHTNRYGLLVVICRV